MTNFIEHVNRQNDLVKQVMRQDIQRRTFERFLQEFRTENMLFLVLHVNDYLASDSDPNRIKKSLKKYFRSVDNEVFSKKSNKRLQRYVVIENLKKQLYRNNYPTTIFFKLKIIKKRMDIKGCYSIRFLR